MIEIQHLTKTYPGGKVAINDLNLQLHPGIFGLVGPNGAGKTTLMRILATLLRPTSGQVRIFGHDLSTSQGKEQVRNLLGYLPQETGLHKSLTVEQELDYFALLKNITDVKKRRKQVETALERVNLERERAARIHTLSGGMKRRLGIAIALLGDPALIIVDEPTVGLDPAERVRFRNLLLEIAGERIVILSTHIISDVSQICTDLAVLNEGKLLFHGEPKTLLARLNGRLWHLPETNITNHTAIQIISSIQTPKGVEHTVFSESPLKEFSQPVSPTLEDAYLWLLQSNRSATFANTDPQGLSYQSNG